MNLQEIKEAVKSGQKVYWNSKIYEVIQDKLGQWMIKCTSNNSCIGLTWADEVTLNGNENEFYLETN